MAFVYGLLYLSLTAYELVFQGVYDISAGVGGLPYFAMVIGELLAWCFDHGDCDCLCWQTRISN